MSSAKKIQTELQNHCSREKIIVGKLACVRGDQTLRIGINLGSVLSFWILTLRELSTRCVDVQFTTNPLGAKAKCDKKSRVHWTNANFVSRVAVICRRLIFLSSKDLSGR